MSERHGENVFRSTSALKALHFGLHICRRQTQRCRKSSVPRRGRAGHCLYDTASPCDAGPRHDGAHRGEDLLLALPQRTPGGTLWCVRVADHARPRAKAQLVVVGLVPGATMSTVAKLPFCVYPARSQICLRGGCRGALRVNVTSRHRPSRPLLGGDRARPAHAKMGAEPPAAVLTALRHAPFIIA